MSNPYDNPPAQQPGQEPYSQGGQYGQPEGQYGQPGGQYGQPAPYGQPYGAVSPEHPQGTTVFVLGIVGIFVGICAPIAWILGNRAIAEATAPGANYSNLQQLKTGRMLGKVFTIIYIVVIVLYIVLLVVLFGVAASQGTN